MMLCLIRHRLSFVVGLLTQFLSLSQKDSHGEREALVWLANVVLVRNIT